MTPERPHFDSPAAIEAAIARDDPAELLHVPIAVSMGADDGAWAEEVCVRLATHPHPNVRGNAVLGFGHLARRFGMLDRAVVLPLVTAALADADDYVAGQADAAMDDLRHFLGWPRPAAAPAAPATAFAASFAEALEAERLSLEPLRVGQTPGAPHAPERHVIVTRDGLPVLRVDVYAHYPDSFTFQDAIIWHDLLVIGFGSHVHVITLADQATLELALGEYFDKLYPQDDYLLIASGERLFRMQPDQSIRWRSELLGIDGVLVHEVDAETIRGDGEWDPPGGWRPFTVRVVDGTIIALGDDDDASTGA